MILEPKPWNTTRGEQTADEAQAIAESKAIAAQYLSLGEKARQLARSQMAALVKLDKGDVCG